MTYDKHLEDKPTLKERKSLMQIDDYKKNFDYSELKSSLEFELKYYNKELKRVEQQLWKTRVLLEEIENRERT